MDKVRVKKLELIGILRKNRQRHARFFKKAYDKYRATVVRELQAMTSEARQGKPIRKVLTLVEPKDHGREYDRIIRMVEMSVDDTVELDEPDFAKYILDDWGWKGEFVQSLAYYLDADEVAGASLGLEAEDEG